MGEMSILRGPDPYAAAEERLAALRSGRQWPRWRDSELCQLLNETIPTYSWVGIYRSGTAGLHLSGWAGEHQSPSPYLNRMIGQQPRVTNNLEAEPRMRPLFRSTRAEALIPFVAPHGSGAIVVASDHRGVFGPADLALLQLAAQALCEREG